MRTDERTGLGVQSTTQVSSRLGSKDVFIVLILFVLSYAGYASIGRQYASKTNNYKRTILGVDSYAVMRHMADTGFSAKPHRSTAHPLFTLLLRPIGVALSQYLNRAQSALLVNIMMAGMGNALFYLCLRKIGLPGRIAILFTLLLAVSAGHLVFSSIPETYAYSFTALTLLIVIFLFCHKLWFWILFLPASLFATGITIINVVFSIILFIAKFWNDLPIAKQMKHLATFLLLFAALFVGLERLQKQVFPNSKDVFSRELISSNTAFLRYDFFSDPAKAIANRLPHLFAYNLVAPGMVRNKVTFPGFDEARPITLISLAMCLALSALSFWQIWRQKIFGNRVFAAVGTYFLFNVLFYLVYGYEPHLYATHYTFALVILLAFPFVAIDSIPPKVRYAFYALLVALIPLVALNNWTFLNNLLNTI